MQVEQSFLAKVFLVDWQRRLTVFFVGLFLWSYVQWFSKYWLEQTTTIVMFSLIIIVLIDMLPNMHRVLCKLLQLLSIFMIVVLMTGYYPVGGQITSFDHLQMLFNDNVVQLKLLTPFLWFSLAAWLIYVGAFHWVQKKWRIIFLLLFSVILFSVVDSFTHFSLWNQVALLLFSGLCLLVIHHFAELKRKNPKNWESFTQYPSMIIIPVILLLIGTMLAGILAPDVRPLLTDPYTAWKQWQGEETVSLGQQEAIFSLTEESLSGYRRGDDLLGAGFTFDHSQVMKVESTYRSYWRGETKSFYSGTGWEMSETEQSASSTAVTSNDLLLQDTRFDNSMLQTVEVKQTFTMLKDEPFPVLFGAFSVAEVLHVNGDSQSGSAAVWSPLQAELQWDEETTPFPQSYSIVSQVPVIDEEGLRTVTLDSLDKQDWQEYLQLPESLPERVSHLAKELTEDEETMYDKVKGIERYLSQNFPYTNQPNMSKATSSDFVDQFLFEVQEGYCDFYSTAMVVLTRAIGVPARWVKGYVSGQSSVDELQTLFPDHDQDVDEKNVYTVLNSNAHSWVEVYFEGWGWIPFEPTATFMLPAVHSEEEEISESVPIQEGHSLSAENESVSHISAGLIWKSILFLVLLLAAWWFINTFQLLARMKAYLKPGNPVNTNDKVVIAYEKLLSYGNRKGFISYEHETIKETLQRWINKNIWLKKDLLQLQSIFEKAKYSYLDVTDEEVNIVQKTIKKVQENM